MAKPSSSAAALHKNLTALLKEHGLTQAEFARRARVPSTTLNRAMNDLEKGLSPRLDTVEAIARGFKLTVSQLLAGETSQSAPAPASPAPHLVAKQLARLVEDFMTSDDEGRKAILRCAEEESLKRPRT